MDRNARVGWKPLPMPKTFQKGKVQTHTQKKDKKYKKIKKRPSTGYHVLLSCI